MNVAVGPTSPLDPTSPPDRAGAETLTDPRPSSSPPAPVTPTRSATETAQTRQPASDELLDELTAWPPQDRVGMFRHWHRGALSLVQLNVVAVIEADGPLSMSRLADELDVSVASATGIVDRMERRGLVERRHATDDRRVVAVHLTDRGAGIFREIAAGRREYLARVLAELTSEERDGLLSGIRAIRAARQRLAQAAAPAAGASGEEAQQHHASGCGAAGDAATPIQTKSGDAHP
ncbi:MAG: MarR family winged helix-turn-helix transcriptional regulator [Candidatus Limnocylindrales bacterium]